MIVIWPVLGACAAAIVGGVVLCRGGYLSENGRMTTVTPDYSQGAAFVRGQYVPIGEAAIPITDWGFLRSDAAYDVVTVWDGAFFRLDAHLERFQASCARFRLDPGLSPAQIIKLGEGGVKTKDDFADLATDELVEMLGDGSMTRKTAEDLIMKARSHWFADEETAEVANG